MPSRAGSEPGSGTGYPYTGQARGLADALERACRKSVEGRGRVAVAFSGGLDSSLLALLCSRFAPVRLYVAGRPGCHDFRAVEGAAGALSLPLRKVEITPEGLRAASERVASAIDSPAPIEIAVAVPLACVCASAGEGAVVTGTGADELFGGYARYSRMALEEALAAMRSDYGRLKERGAATERAIAAAHGKSALHPYIDPDVEAIAQAAGAGGHFWNGGRKTLLREAALCAGLPAELAGRPKKAAQYGSGVARMLASEARKSR